MLGLKEQVFGDIGYATNLKLGNDELQQFRQLINQHWLSRIESANPALLEEATEKGIEYYHHISDKIDHSNVWTKGNRVLPQHAVEQIKSFPFFSTLKAEFGDFSVSDVYDTEQHHGQEEIYWRLVRPNVPTDIGHLHKDKWFHNTANGGYGMFPDDVVTVKLWIAIYCEKGKSGLSLLAGSHYKDWKYHMVYENKMAHPILDEDPQSTGAELIPTNPGDTLIFNDGVLHGGVLNVSDKTRVSAEITIVLDRSKVNIKY